ncbi:ankyrin repeat domain-containing protein 50-like [Nematostella vectensis]|uniref:ankyrin repeat domain-containing protein 50-like n=1 Tax=Nematostella vectensis TaxID=45351 RepID=UPI002076E15C|nr:ankyrin repeat domain-containing protein 50-like [Nematostella vectensis]XP_048589197.1 ankyrin repeat domain-containing protein 50-like [Nematostella vectensis]
MNRKKHGRRTFYCREWLFEKVQTCLERRKQQEDLRTKGTFIVGGPGSGKTSLLSELISPSSQDGVQYELSTKVVAYHFCQAHYYKSILVSEFVRTLAEQLSNSEPLRAYREIFNQPQIQEHLMPEQCARNPDLSFKEGVLLPLNSIPPPEDCFLLVVDSIDESFLHSFDAGVFTGSKTIAELIATHIDLLPPWLFLVISARKQSKTVTKMFTGFRKLTLDDLRKPHVVKDIQSYILNRLDDDSELRKHLTRETAEIFNQLHIKSNGCFLYLEKILDCIEDGCFSIEEAQDIPGTLNGFYLWLCDHLYSEEQFNQIKLVLDVILAAQKPLKESELFEAVWTRDTALTPERFQAVLDQMDHIINDIRGTKCIFHHSFAEWLIDVKHCTPQYLCSPADGHAMLALRCTQQASTKKHVDSHEFAVHLSRASFKDEFTKEHLALWLLWSKALNSDDPIPSEYPPQEALKILLDAGVDLSELNLEEEIVDFGKETEESIRALLEKGSPVDNVDGSGRTQLCNAAFNGSSNVVRLLLQHGANVNFSDPSGQTPLMLAARQGHGDIVYLLVNCGSDPNHVADDGCTALRLSASAGHSDVVSVLLKHQAHVDLADDDKRTALRGAAWGGHSDVVLQLLQYGANPNLTDNEGRTALIAAAYMGHKNVVQILLEHGAKVNHADQDGRTALAVTVLCASSSADHTDVVQLLLENGADVDHPDFDGMTPLCVACLEGHYSIVKLLLEFNADAGHWDRNGRTPLFAAAASGHVGVVKMLLDNHKRAQPKAANTWRSPRDAMFRADHNAWSPLMVAAFQGHSLVVRCLLEAGVRLDDRDAGGKTALIIAAQEGHSDVVITLLNFGTPINQTTDSGNTALYYAAMEGHEEVVEQLFKMGADVNTKDTNGRTALFSVAVEGKEAMAAKLLKLGATVDCADNEGRTPLQAVAWQGCYNLVNLFLKHNADVNLPDNEGRTALMSAAWQGHASIIQLMVDKGALVDMVSFEGATALCIAAQEGHDEVAQILLENGANMNHADSFGRTPMQVASEAGHNKIMKALEAYSVVRMNDNNIFTSTLQRKISCTNTDSSSTPTSEPHQKETRDARKESVSSSGSSSPGSRQDIHAQGDHDDGMLTPLAISGERRYSSSFLEVHNINPSKPSWGGACPPYSSQEAVHHEPPPYTELASHLKVNDDIVAHPSNSPKSRRNPFSMLQRVRIKSPFASGSSERRSRKFTERRGLFATRKSQSEGYKTGESQVEMPCTSGFAHRLSDPMSSIETAV